MPRDLTLSCGKTLHIQEADFNTANDLFVCVAEELKSLKVDPNAEVDVNFLKDIFLSAVSSKKVSAALWACFKSVTIDDVRISKDTFEPVDMRSEYYTVCWEVAHDNILPFMKNHLSALSPFMAALRNSPKLKESSTTP